VWGSGAQSSGEASVDHAGDSFTQNLELFQKARQTLRKERERDDESTLPHLPFWLFWPPPQKREKYILKISTKSLMSLVVISYNLKPVKISYANVRVSVRIFYKNNLISFRF
jgi:hypothetical protein